MIFYYKNSWEEELATIVVLDSISVTFKGKYDNI
jgi:hypothetical protein